MDLVKNHEILLNVRLKLFPEWSLLGILYDFTSIYLKFKYLDYLFKEDNDS